MSKSIEFYKIEEAVPRRILDDMLDPIVTTSDEIINNLKTLLKFIVPNVEIINDEFGMIDGMIDGVQFKHGQFQKVAIMYPYGDHNVVPTSFFADMFYDGIKDNFELSGCNAIYLKSTCSISDYGNCTRFVIRVAVI